MQFMSHLFTDPYGFLCHDIIQKKPNSCLVTQASHVNDNLKWVCVRKTCKLHWTLDIQYSTNHSSSQHSLRWLEYFCFVQAGTAGLINASGSEFYPGSSSCLPSEKERDTCGQMWSRYSRSDSVKSSSFGFSPIDIDLIYVVCGQANIACIFEEMQVLCWFFTTWLFRVFHRSSTVHEETHDEGGGSSSDFEIGIYSMLNNYRICTF